MTAQILSTELANLISESKRKNPPELRVTAEKSLEELKALRTTSEAQISADLSLRPNFVTPFLVACGTKNAKFTGIAVVCLQRLVASRSLPKSRLKEVLEAFREATSSGLDVQLKILQSLPALLQNYAEDLKGDLLASALNVCTILQSSKNGIVNNTAAATLQQLVVAVFDKVVAEDKLSLEVPTTAEAPGESGPVQIRAAAYDAYRVFNDLCLLTENQRPNFLKVNSLPQTFGLELIESILTNHADIFLSHDEQAHVLRTRVMPFIVGSLSDRTNFATTVRVVRILFTLLRSHLSILAPEAEMALGLLIQMLDADTAVWKRALCMEVLRGLFGDASLLRQIFALYDAQEGRKNVLTDIVATFVRLSSEKPSLLGLGAQSTMPTQSRYTSNSDSNDHAMLEATGVAGIISSPMSTGEANVGISTQWSSMRIPCIDQLDKSDPPAIPETYIYSLGLTCINNFSEGLAKFILPLTVPKKLRSVEMDAAKGASESVQQRNRNRALSAKKNNVPLNPLDLKDHALHNDVEICAAIVERCWPAILATCSTFFHAALDAEYYHGLVRSFQKFTHVAGLLRLSTPRDAFLTTLGKASVPPNIFSASSGSSSIPTSPSNEQPPSIFNNPRGLLGVDAISSTASTDKSRQTSVADAAPSLNTRNMLCLRALLNLGIALGPTLDSAWLIVLECLQQADFILYSSTRATSRTSMAAGSKSESQGTTNNPTLLANFGSEIKAVETAASRLFESTADFPNQSFVEIVVALCKLFGGNEVSEGTTHIASTPGSPSFARKGSHTHRRINSLTSSSPSQSQEDFFGLAKLGDVASINIERLLLSAPEDSGWSIMTTQLVKTIVNNSVEGSVRTRAAETLVKVVTEAARATLTLPGADRGEIQWRLLDTFRKAVDLLQHIGHETSVSSTSIDIEVHKIILEGFKDILENCGELLISGWDIAFEIIGSVFSHDRRESSGSIMSISARRPSSRSPKLVKSSFNSLQLICSDFLSSIPSECFLILVDTLYDFCTQNDDLNICLTTVTFFWVLSDFISSRGESFSISPHLIESTDEHSLKSNATSTDLTISNGALWMLLLLRLTVVTTDDRPELRNSAIQTLIRIFDANGEQLSAEAWLMCLQSVIFKMFTSIEQRVKSASENENHYSDKDKSAWTDTTVLVLNGVSSLLATYLHTLTGHESFSACWAKLLGHFTSLLKYENLDIHTAIFKALQVILAQANTDNEISAILDKPSQTLVWKLWSADLPLLQRLSVNPRASNQACLIAYVSSLHEIYRIIESDVDVEQTTRILELLRETIQKASAEAYSADVDHLTSLQSRVLESLRLIRTDIPGVPSAMISQAADLVAMAYQKPSDDQPNMKRPTYVALSKAAMSFLESLILAHADDAEIYQGSALTSALIALSLPIDLKYSSPVTTKSTAPWRVATSTTLKILPATLPKVSSLNLSTLQINTIWQAIVLISNAMIAANPPTSPAGPSFISLDQEFDISSFLALRNLIIPELGNSIIRAETRKSYTEALFNNSFVHAPATGDIPDEGEDIMLYLKKARRGRTVDPAPSNRKEMAYICMQELFSLVSIDPLSQPLPQSTTDFENKRIRLAQASAPYLLLRCGISLKTYAADQPLRGLCPQPLSQKKELCFLLKNLVQLRCIEEAIPDCGLVGSGEKKHLTQLYGLLIKAVGMDRAMGAEEVQRWIKRALNVVGDELGV